MAGNGGPPICITCGQPHIAYNGKPGCTAHKSTDSTEPCRREPSKGLRVCEKHGGGNARSRAKSRAYKKREKHLRSIGATLGDGPTEVDAVTALHLQIAWSQTHVDWYRLQVQALVPDALVWGEAEVRESDMQGLTTVEKAEANMWLKHYNGERERLVNMCAKAIGAGLAEREVRVAEQLGAQLNEVIRLVLADLELSPDQQKAALKAVPRHLRAIEGSDPAA